MINYTLPDFTSALGLNLFFARIAMEHPGWMQDDVRIDSIYGCFPGCLLNGGRAVNRDRVDAARVKWTFDVLAEYGIKARLTLTNMMADQAALDDPYSTLILEQAAAHGAEAIVYSDLVADTLRTRYGMPLVLSTTREILDPAALNDALERFDYVVLNYNFGKDDAFLGQVRNRDRLEVMVNEYCQPHCPLRQKHYQHNSQDQRQGTLRDFPCPHHKPSFFEHKPGDPIIFTDDEVRSCSQRYGIPWFKIVGRGTSFEANLEALTYYLLKPPYRQMAKQQVYAQMRH